MRALFLGSKKLGLRVFQRLREANPAVEWAILHAPDASDSRSVLSEFSAYSVEHGVAFQVVGPTVSLPGFLKEFQPEICFVCGWYQILRAEMLAAVPLGFYGIHPSLLPRYRGAAPLVWSIINGDERVGATVFKFAPGVDDGPILYQAVVENRPEDDIGSLLERIEADILDHLPAWFAAALDDTARLVTQDESQASHCGQRIPDDGLINWQWPSRRVHDFIRAQAPPYPGAFSYLGDSRITILKTGLDDRRYYGVPGQVLERAAEHDVVVCCGNDTALKILRLACDGREVPPREALRSVTLRLSSHPTSR